MKVTVSIFLVFVVMTVRAQQPQPADILLQNAMEQATQEKKNVFVFFHASWCHFCHDMDSAMNRPGIKELFQKSYIIVPLDVYESEDDLHLENPGAVDFLEENAGPDEGVPYWMILNPSGDILADSRIKKRNSGYPSGKKGLDHFIRALQKTSSLDHKELTLIANAFQKKGAPFEIR